MKLAFEADVDGQPRIVNLHFGNDVDLAELRRWRSSRLSDNPHVRDAIEYARLASKRWAYYHRNGETATNIEHLRKTIERNSKAEIAFMLMARGSWLSEGSLLGLAYCRRSWCHRLIVDFVAVHPHVVGRVRGHIRGIGTGLFNGLIRIADKLEIKIIWGEATVNSAPFYERILGAERIYDQFVITGETMERCRRQLGRMHSR